PSRITYAPTGRADRPSPPPVPCASCPFWSGPAPPPPPAPPLTRATGTSVTPSLVTGSPNTVRTVALSAMFRSISRNELSTEVVSVVDMTPHSFALALRIRLLLGAAAQNSPLPGKSSRLTEDGLSSRYRWLGRDPTGRKARYLRLLRGELRVMST